MNTLILLIDRASTWSPQAWAAQHGGEPGVADQITIERGGEWLSIVADNRVVDEFDAGERCRLGELVAEPSAYIVEWTGGRLLEHLLRSVPADVHAAVDNDHGLIVRVQEIANRPIESWIGKQALVDFG